MQKLQVLVLVVLLALLVLEVSARRRRLGKFKRPHRRPRTDPSCSRTIPNYRALPRCKTSAGRQAIRPCSIDSKCCKAASGVYVCVPKSSSASSSTPVDGGWAEWSDWGTCKVQYGFGSQERFRACINPAPANGGKVCDGPDRQTQTCQPVRCRKLLCSLTAEQQIGLNSSDIDSCTQELSFTCEDKYNAVAPPKRACQGGGQWSGKLCEATAIDGVWSEWSNWGSCTMTSAGGFQKRNRNCEPPTGKPCDGERIDYQPCELVSCSDHECSLTEEQQVGMTSHSIDNCTQELVFSCNQPEYALVEPVNRTCLGGNRFSGSPAFCFRAKEKTCPELINLEGGKVDVTDRTVGSEAVYTCHSGSVCGNDTLVCQENYEWSSEPPTCVPSCPFGDKEKQGVATHTLSSCGQEIMFTCQPGYKPTGPLERKCQANGKWTSSCVFCVNEK